MRPTLLPPEAAAAEVMQAVAVMRRAVVVMQQVAAVMQQAVAVMRQVAADTVATGAAVMPGADIVVAADMAAAETTADTVVDTVATMVRATGLAPAFRCRCRLLVAGKPAAERLIDLKVGPPVAAGHGDMIQRTKS